MTHRRQNTIERSATIAGYGLFGGADVTLEFLPAPEFHGLVFQRVDLPGGPRIPAHIACVVPQPRRTALAREGAVVEVTEHVLAALAGLKIDNCLIRLNAPEPPNGDGSARHFVDALLGAGIVEQNAFRPTLQVPRGVIVGDAGQSQITASPGGGGLRVSYRLDYGQAPLPRQALVIDVTRESFLKDISSARTFVLESEVTALRAQGLGLRTTARDLLVYREDGTIIDNALRFPDECVRHKILDCIGDLALAGADIIGEIHALRSGHQQNHEVIRQLMSTATLTRGRPRAA
jgi:UDP-3-O-[3-hydroxymyristoyl] N-acetylglucosamine deacetylase